MISLIVNQLKSIESWKKQNYGVSSKGLLHFYRAAFSSVLTFAITVWFGSVSARGGEAGTASKITGCEILSLSEIY